MADRDAEVLLARLAALSDLARLRLLRLLAREELSVGELAAAVQLPQSTVSRHLKLLHEGGWIVRRAAGTASLYQLIEDDLDDGARDLWQATSAQMSDSATLTSDDERLAHVLADRRLDSKAFFGRLGGEWDELREQMFGRGFTSEALLGLLATDAVIADLGCGTGNAAMLLAPLVGRLIAVDQEAAMLDAARKRLSGLTNIEFRAGDLLNLPLKDGEVDAAITVLVLHHIEAPREALKEMQRIVKPGGRIMIVDMVAHDRDEYRRTMGHQHLGFSEETLATWAEELGLSDVRYQRLRPDITSKGPALFSATMRV